MAQKAVEMGASRIQPVLTRRTQASRVKLDRLRANAVEAAEQCGVLSLPEIVAEERLERVLDGWPDGRRLVFCDEAADVANPVEALRAVPRGPLAVLVGPEGGFDEAERRRLLGLPFVTAIALGPRVLRADTAAVAALAVVQATLGDWG
jgi:16S rRNA (uracil1498-N3)-methyltransferase